MFSKITIAISVLFFLVTHNVFAKEKKGDELSGVCIDNKVALKIKTYEGKQKTLFLLVKGTRSVACSVPKTKINVTLLSDPTHGLSGEGFTVSAIADIDTGEKDEKGSKVILKVFSTFQEKAVPRDKIPGSVI